MHWGIWVLFSVYRMLVAVGLEYGFLVGCSLSNNCFETAPICYYPCKLREALHIDLTDYLAVDPVFAEGGARIRLAAGLFGILSPLICLIAWKKYKRQNIRDLALVLASIIGSFLVLYGTEMFMVSPNPVLVNLYNLFDWLILFGLIQEVLSSPSPSQHLKKL
mmetsp:Transcript_1331/g.1777  ORF Transcript_1331/g.1777 Transcript_1331/m.1777 type:complete len:163 (+) Transcript_1331:18-506(+)